MSTKHDYALPSISETITNEYAHQMDELLADSCPVSPHSVIIWDGQNLRQRRSGATGSVVIWEKFGDCSLFIDALAVSFNVGSNGAERMS